jgi:penicillin-binding protein 1A
MSMRRRPAWRRSVRRALRIVIVVVVCLPIFAVTAGAVGLATLVYGDLDEGPVPKPREPFKSEPSKVFLAGPDGQPGEQIAEFREFDLTLPMKREDIPQVLKDALVAAEDHQFWTHAGVDPFGLVRAAQANFEEGRTVQGGSTLTQQLVRERYLTRDRTVERKFNEVLLATRFERDLTAQVQREMGLDPDRAEHEAKERILFEYLDVVYFGAGAYGAQAGAQTYFHKNVNDLTAAEAATLVAIIPAPSKYSPRENLAVADQRRKDLLTEMHGLTRTDGPDGGRGGPPMLTDSEFAAAIDQSIWYAGFGYPPKPMTIIFPPPAASYSKYPYYVDYIRQYVIDKYGPDLLYRGGLRITAAVDPRLQALAELSVGNTLSGTSSPLEMSLVSIEPSTGLVKALVGGRDWNASQVNLATGGSAGMQPGSAFKAFTVAKAFEEGYTADTSYFAPAVLTVPGCNGHCDIRGGTGSVIDLRNATANSVNTYFAQLVLDVGPDNVAELANRVGVTRITLDKQYNLGITLGAFEVSPLDMAAGFSVFANHGVKPGQTPVTRILDSAGKVLEDNIAPHGARVLNAAVADWTTEMLTGGPKFGTGTAAQIGRPIAGKTGTAQDFRAAWFVGYAPQLATAVWMGYSDTPKPLVGIKGVGQVFGGTLPARTWAAYMRPALTGSPALEFTPPGILPPPMSTIRQVPRDASIPSMPVDCQGPCVVRTQITSPSTTAPPADTSTSPTSAGVTTTTAGGVKTESSTTTSVAKTPKGAP